MKILYIVPHYGEMKGGTSLRSPAVAEFLSDKNCEVTVIAPQINSRVQGGEQNCNDFERNGVNVRHVHYPACFRKSSYHRFYAEFIYLLGILFKTLSLKFDHIIIAYPPAFAPLLIFSRLLFFRRATFHLEIRDLMAGALEASGYVKFKILTDMASLYEKAIIRSFESLIPVSPGILGKCGVDYSKKIILPCYNGVERDVIAWSPDNVKAEVDRICRDLDLTTNKYAIYAGALTQSYDIKKIIDSFLFTECADKKLLILGGGDKLEQYKDYVNNKKDNRITFHPFVARDVALGLIKNAKFCVHAFNSSPHWSYVLGNKVFDYLCMGRPVLFIGIGTTADMLSKIPGCRVVSPNSKQLAVSEITEMFSDIDRSVEIRGIAEQKLSRDQQLRIFWGVWQKYFT